MTEISVRIDQWLWAARFFRTRSLAQRAIELGRVRAGGERVRSSRPVRVGDRLTVEREGERFELTVIALSASRGPASAARLLYDESEESRARRAALAERARLAAEPARSRAGGRPTKRDGRLIRGLDRGGG